MRDVRHVGLMIGVEMEFDAAPIVARCLEQGLLINCTQGNVLRLLPAMNIEAEQVAQGMEIFTEAVCEVANSLAQSDATVPG